MIFRPGMTWNRYQLTDIWKWGFWSNKKYEVDMSQWSDASQRNMARNLWTK